MADQQKSHTDSTITSEFANHEKKSELVIHSNSTSSTHLLERNTKQIQIKEESTVRKVLKTREVKHYNNSGELVQARDSSNIQENGHSNVDNEQTIQDIKRTNDSESNDRVMHIQPPNEMSFPTTNTLYNPSDQALGNYQNLMSRNTSDFVEQISNQDNPMQSSQPIIQPLQRTTVRNSSIPHSGYEELDSTLEYSSQQQQQNRPMMENSQNSIYNTKNSILVPPISSDSAIMIHPESSQTGSFMNHKSNYDIAYGTTGADAPIIAANSSNIYGTRVVPEPVYAVNRDGALTYIGQTNVSQTNDVRWRNPELEEVISFLSNSDPMIRANSVAYLQHLSYADDHIKQRTRLLGGIPLLIDLLNRDILEVQRNVCGALRNLSFGKKNDDNKRAVRDAHGIQALVRTLINNPDNEIRELATSVLWNLSSCEDIKWSIVDAALYPLVSVILVPYTSWFKANFSNSQQYLPTSSETHWSTVFRNTTGVLRNISSAGAHARKQLRDCAGLIESLFFIMNTSISRNDMENKLVENCVCVLRNLSYRCQETQDPDYDKHFYGYNSRSASTNDSMQNSPSSPSSSANLTTSLVGQVTSRVSENIGCFSFAKRSRSKSKSSFLSSRNTSSNATQNDPSGQSMENRSTTILPPHHPSNISGSNNDIVRTSTQIDGMNGSVLPPSGVSNIAGNQTKITGRDLLWQSEVVKPYLALLSGCSNPETLEAAAGAIQNLAACYWQPSVEIRAAVRKERGLPVLVELLRVDKDTVVCVVATALRNLAIDQKNKELIGKYAMPDLVNKLRTNQGDHDSHSSDDTIAAVLATLHEVISNNVDFVRSFYEAGGLNKLTYIVRNKHKYSSRVQRFAAQVSIR